jgi:hypothetical protein
MERPRGDVRFHFKKGRMLGEGVVAVAESGRKLVFNKTLWSKGLEMVAEDLGEGAMGKGAFT